MAYGNIYGGGFGGFTGYSPQEQALTYGQRRYLRGRPSLSQQAEYAGGYAVPLYSAQQQREEQEQYANRQRQWYDKQAEMLTSQIDEYKKQAELSRISEQEMFKQTSTLEKQLAEKRQTMERQIAERQLEQQKLQGRMGMGLQAATTGLLAAPYIKSGISSLMGGAGPAMGGAGPAMAAVGEAAGGVYGSGSLGYGGVALGSSGPPSAGIGAGTVAGYAAPAAIGFGVGQYVRGEGGSSGEARRYGMASGAATGAAIGSVVPGIGTAIGAGVGALGGLVGGSCIIVSSCTDPDSYEVDITREFRDNHLDPITLKGYYKLASKIVPMIKQYDTVKAYIKEFLVNRLIDFGEVFMGYKEFLKYDDSEFVTMNFLNECYSAGLGEK